MKNILRLVFVAAFGFILLNPLPAQAQTIDIYKACEGNITDEVCKNKGAKVEPIFKNVVNFLLMILGIISVIMIVIGGFLYATSSGDSNKTTTAKNTILYAVIGVAVALLAYTIVNFAFTEITK